MAPARSRLLVIGYGNPLRGDDGLGWRVAEQLAELLGDSTVRLTHQLTPELAEPISEAELVIFVDARHTGKPGGWRYEKINSEPMTPQAFSHHFAPANLLGYAKALFGVNPVALLISASGRSFDVGDRLSSSVAAVVPEIVRFIFEFWGEQIRPETLRSP